MDAGPLDRGDPASPARFASALAVLDAALAVLKPDKAFGDENDPFQLCKDPPQVLERLLPACADDGRFPSGYAGLLEQHCTFFKRAGYRPDLSPASLVNVDPNLENTIWDAAREAVVFVDLDLELRTIGYALGPALFWWLHSTSTASIDYGLVRSLLSGYRSATSLAPAVIGNAPMHLLNFSFMELALPIAFLVGSATPGIDPLDRIEDRLARARLIFDERERLIDEVEALLGSTPLGG